MTYSRSAPGSLNVQAAVSNNDLAPATQGRRFLPRRFITHRTGHFAGLREPHCIQQFSCLGNLCGLGNFGGLGLIGG